MCDITYRLYNYYLNDNIFYFISDMYLNIHRDFQEN